MLNLNKQEQTFINALMDALSDFPGIIKIERLSNNALNVTYNGCQIGRIKLTGKKYWMQILKNLYDSDSIEGSVDDFIRHIPEWVRYTKYIEKI